MEAGEVETEVMTLEVEDTEGGHTEGEDTALSMEVGAEAEAEAEDMALLMVEEAEEAGVKLLSARRMGVVAAVVAVEEEG